jgi:hypothetical protein
MMLFFLKSQYTAPIIEIFSQNNVYVILIIESLVLFINTKIKIIIKCTYLC